MRLRIVNLIKKYGLLRHITSVIFANNLAKLSLIHDSDKYVGHFYTQHYQEHFKKFRKRKLKLLEIGVGGYNSPYNGGNSLRMWSYYFPFGDIYSFDIYKKELNVNRRINITQGDQSDSAFFLSTPLILDRLILLLMTAVIKIRT